MKLDGRVKVHLTANKVCFWDRSASGMQRAVLYNAVLGRWFYPGVSGQLRPGLFGSFKANSDFTHWNFFLRSGLKFSSGEPLDIQTVRAAFETIMETPGDFPEKSLLINVKTIEADPKENALLIQLKNSDPDFGALLQDEGFSPGAPSALPLFHEPHQVWINPNRIQSVSREQQDLCFRLDLIRQLGSTEKGQ